MKKRKKIARWEPPKRTEAELKLAQELDDSIARHMAGNRVIEELRKEVHDLRVRAETAEKHADHVVMSFVATLNMVRGSR